MHINRLNGFFIGGTFEAGDSEMTIDDQNKVLNEALDVRFAQLKAVWEAHEKALKDMRPIVPVECCYANETHEDGFAEHSYYLGYWRDNGQWRIFHGYQLEPHQERIDWTPIHEAAAKLRVKAAEHIDDLRKAIVTSKEEFIPELDNAIATLANGLDNYKLDKK